MSERLSVLFARNGEVVLRPGNVYYGQPLAGVAALLDHHDIGVAAEGQLVDRAVEGPVHGDFGMAMEVASNDFPGLAAHFDAVSADAS